MKSVYIIHSALDGEIVRRLSESLAGKGVKTVAPPEVLPGQNISLQLKTRMRYADAFLIVITPRLLDSHWPFQELEFAYSRRRDAAQIIPIIVEVVDSERMPPLLLNLKWVDLTGDFDAGVDLLVQALESENKPSAEEESKALLTKLQWIELVIGMLIAALVTVIGYGSVTDLSYLYPVFIFAGGLGGLTAVIAWANDRRTRSPIELVKRNTIAAFVNALEESALNPLREESSNAKTR